MTWRWRARRATSRSHPAAAGNLPGAAGAGVAASASRVGPSRVGGGPVPAVRGRLGWWIRRPEATVVALWAYEAGTDREVLDAFFLRYQREGEGRKPFLEWLVQDYDEAALRRDFHANGLASFINDWVLVHE